MSAPTETTSPLSKDQLFEPLPSLVPTCYIKRHYPYKVLEFYEHFLGMDQYKQCHYPDLEDDEGDTVVGGSVPQSSANKS